MASCKATWSDLTVPVIEPQTSLTHNVVFNPTLPGWVSHFFYIAESTRVSRYSQSCPEFGKFKLYFIRHHVSSVTYFDSRYFLWTNFSKGNAKPEKSLVMCRLYRLIMRSSRYSGRFLLRFVKTIKLHVGVDN